MDRWDDIQLLSNLGLKANYQWDSDPWPQQMLMRCPTNWAMKPHIGSSDMNSARNKLTLLPMCGFIHCSSVGRASHWYSQRSWVWIPLKPWFFQASSFQLLKLKLTVMMILHSHLQPQFNNIIMNYFILYFTSSPEIVWQCQTLILVMYKSKKKIHLPIKEISKGLSLLVYFLLV